jgi:hypothetical protein
LYSKLNKNPSSSLIIVKNDEIIYSKILKEINNFEIEKIKNLLYFENIKFKSNNENSIFETNYRKYAGNNIINPILKNNNLFLFDDLEKTMYRINKNGVVDNFINFKELFTDSFILKSILDSKIIIDTAKKRIIDNYKSTVLQTNRNSEIYSIYSSDSFLYVNAKVYLTAFIYGREVIIYPTFSFVFNYDGKLVSVKDYEWSLNKAMSKYLFFDEVINIKNEEFYTNSAEYDTGIYYITYINYKDKNYQNVQQKFAKQLPSSLPKLSERNIPLNYYLKKVIQEKNVLAYFNQYPILWNTNNKDSIILTHLSSNGSDNTKFFIENISFLKNQFYVFWYNEVDKKMYLNTYDKKGKFQKQRFLENEYLSFINFSSDFFYFYIFNKDKLIFKKISTN